MANPGSQEAALLAQKKQASNTWMLLDTNGHKTLLEVGKHAIMYRVGIHARDLRILDPLLSYPSTILGRERAIVLNLEHIKAIITAEEVLLRDPMHESVVSLVEEFQKRLPGGGLDSLGQERSEGHNDDYIPGSDGFPFEFRALEVALQAICSFLYARTTELEKDAYPALDELTMKISNQNLDRVRKLKSSMTRLNARVQKVKDELEQLLHDDDDMADLFLTRKMLGAPSSLPNSGVLNWAPPAATIVSTKVSDDADVDELEMLLEAYFTQIDGILHKLTSLREYIDDTEDYINMQLDNHRNKLIQLELILNVANIVMAVFSFVTAIFGMNLPYSWNVEHPEAFTWVVVVTSITCLVGFISVLGYARYQHLIGD